MTFFEEHEVIQRSRECEQWDRRSEHQGVFRGQSCPPPPLRASIGAALVRLGLWLQGERGGTGGAARCASAK